MIFDVSSVAAVIVSAVLPNLLSIVASVALTFLTPLAAKYIGQQRALLLQQQADAILHRAIGYAVPQVEGLIKRQGYTVEVQNDLAKIAAAYVSDHAPVIAAKIAPMAGQLEAKALSRLASHPDVQAAVAGKAPPDVSNDNAPSSAAA